MSYITWRCPECGSKNLNVMAAVEHTLLQDENGEFETVPYKHATGVEWDRNSIMICRSCDCVSSAGQFEMSVEERERDETSPKVVWILWDNDEMRQVGRSYVDYDECVADARRANLCIIRIESPCVTEGD